MHRLNTVRSIAGKETKAKLKALGKAFVDCWNEVNHETVIHLEGKQTLLSGENVSFSLLVSGKKHRRLSV
jgi:hypothetical protein